MNRLEAFEITKEKYQYLQCILKDIEDMIQNAAKEGECFVSFYVDEYMKKNNIKDGNAYTLRKLIVTELEKLDFTIDSNLGNEYKIRIRWL